MKPQKYPSWSLFEDFFTSEVLILLNWVEGASKFGSQGFECVIPSLDGKKLTKSCDLTEEYRMIQEPGEISYPVDKVTFQLAMKQFTSVEHSGQPDPQCCSDLQIFERCVTAADDSAAGEPVDVLWTLPGSPVCPDWHETFCKGCLEAALGVSLSCN